MILFIVTSTANDHYTTKLILFMQPDSFQFYRPASAVIFHFKLSAGKRERTCNYNNSDLTGKHTKFQLKAYDIFYC